MTPPDVPILRGSLPRENEKAYRELRFYEDGIAEAELGSLHEDVSENWRRVRAQFEPHGEGALDRLLATPSLRDRIRGSVCDMAAGTCWVSGRISRLEAVDKVFAQDLSEGFFARVGRPSFIDYGGDLSKLTFVASDFNHVPLDDGSMDCVFLFAAVHHSLAPISTVREAVRLLRPGGTLFMLEAPVAVLGLERKRRWSLQFVNVTETPFTYYDHRFFLRMAGIEDFEAISMGHSRGAVRRAIRKLLHSWPDAERWLRPPTYLFVARKP